MRWMLKAACFAFSGVAAFAQDGAPAKSLPPQIKESAATATELRVATFNIEDVRTRDLADPNQPRLRRLAEVIQRIRPTVILLNEITYDAPGGPDVPENSPGGRNAQAFADRFLAHAQATDVEPLRYKAFMAASNTGVHSGLDLDHDGKVTDTYPPVPPAGTDGAAPAQTDDGRAYGGDCWGFGTFPGQYGMALLVDERLEILTDQVRTFRLLPWDYMSGALLPPNADGTGQWLNDDQKKVFRLSSKSHWDVPVKLPDGSVLHFLCSHPTPPAFDGPEKRNARRNHDEIRFWADYVDATGGASYIVDDANHPGGLAPSQSFVILGDLNADPKKGSSFKNPMALLFLGTRRVNSSVVPKTDREVDGLQPTDAASFKLRVDYVLPSRNLGVKAAGIWRTLPAGAETFPSDHFPVWMDLVVPAPAATSDPR